MTNNEYVEKLYLKQDDLKRICNYHGIFGDTCNEIIQEFYIKMLKLKNIDRYVMDDQPNMYIMFIILKNMIFDFRKKIKKISPEPLYDFDIPEEEFENEKYDLIINEIEHIDYWFDKTIIKLYIFDNHTIRSLAKDTKISFSTIQPIIHKFKEKCKERYNKNL